MNIDYNLYKIFLYLFEENPFSFSFSIKLLLLPSTGIPKNLITSFWAKVVSASIIAMINENAFFIKL